MASPSKNTTPVSIITNIKGSGKYRCIILFEARVNAWNIGHPPFNMRLV
jgi:hypothetical protein